MTTNTKLSGLFSAAAPAAGSIIGQTAAVAAEQTDGAAANSTGTPFLSAFLKMLFGIPQGSAAEQLKKLKGAETELDGDTKAVAKVAKSPEGRAADSVRALAFLANAKTTPQTEELRNALLQCDAQLNVIVPGTPVQQLSYVVSDPEDGNTTAKRPGDHLIELDTDAASGVAPIAAPPTAAQALVAAMFSGQITEPAPVQNAGIPLVTAEARPLSANAQVRQRASLSLLQQQPLIEPSAPAIISRKADAPAPVPAAGIELAEEMMPPVTMPSVVMPQAEKEAAPSPVPAPQTAAERTPAPEAKPSANQEQRRNSGDGQQRPPVEVLPRGGVRIPAAPVQESVPVKAAAPAPQRIEIPLVPAALSPMVRTEQPEASGTTDVPAPVIPAGTPAVVRQARPVRTEKHSEQRSARPFAEQLKDAQQTVPTEEGAVQITDVRSSDAGDDAQHRPQEQRTAQAAPASAEQPVVRTAEKQEFRQAMNEVTGIGAAPAAEHRSAVGPLKNVMADMDHSTVQSMLDQLSKGVSVAVKEERSEMKLILHPEALGEVTVRVRVSEGKVSTAMDVQQVQVKQTIEANLPQLRESLTSKGLTMEHIEITTSQQSLADEASRQRQGSERRKGRQEFELAADEDEGVKLFGYNTVEYTM